MLSLNVRFEFLDKEMIKLCDQGQEGSFSDKSLGTSTSYGKLQIEMEFLFSSKIYWQFYISVNFDDFDSVPQAQNSSRNRLFVHENLSTGYRLLTTCVPNFFA